MNAELDKIQEWLQQGIAAVKAGQMAEAQTWLARVLAADPANVPGWLWLSSAVSDADARVECLMQALDHNPEHPQLRKALEIARTRQVQAWMQGALQAEIAGDRLRARELLMQVLAADEANVAAWWELGQVVELPEEQEICLENVLALDPDHAPARQALTDIRREREAESSSESLFIGDTTLPDTMFVPVVEPSPLAEATDYRSPIELNPAEIASAAMFSDELMCPACAAMTVYADRRCTTCGRPLWLQGRVVTQTRPAYGLALAFEGVILLVAGLLPFLYIAYATLQVEPSDFGMVLQFYLGRLPDVPPGYPAVLTAAPSLFFWLPFVPGVLAVLIATMILTRWQPLFYVGVTLSGIRILLGVINVLFLVLGGLGSVAAGDRGGMLASVTLRYMRFGIGLGALISLIFSGISLVFLLGIQDHFEITERRLLLKLDRDVDHTSASFWMHGRRHAQDGLWALAALHLRHALIIEQRLEVYLQLTVAYVNLGYWEMADRTLADARRFSPDNPQVESMAALVAQKRAAEAA